MSAPAPAPPLWGLMAEFEGPTEVVEAAREVGGRELLRLPFQWPPRAPTTAKVAGEHELGAVLPDPVEDQVDGRPAAAAGAHGVPLDDLGVGGPALGAVAVDLGRSGPGLARLDHDAGRAERDADQVGQG